MGYCGKLELKFKAQDLRKKGWSYSEIRRAVNVSKGTLSLWCRDVAITEEQALNLFKKKLVGAEKGRIIGAKRQQKKRMDNIKQLAKEGRKQVGNLTLRDQFIAGIALYLAEGTKADRAVGFANTDTAAVRFMMHWFRNFCKVPEEKFKGAIWLHEGLNERNAVNYWAGVTNIKPSNFHKTYIDKNKKDSKKIRKNIHQYGVFSVRFGDAKVSRLIDGWMSGLLKDYVV
ncbi:MAG: hypothetical protein ABIG86_02930 [Patescibacteria group bacterium]